VPSKARTRHWALTAAALTEPPDLAQPHHPYRHPKNSIHRGRTTVSAHGNRFRAPLSASACEFTVHTPFVLGSVVNRCFSKRRQPSRPCSSPPSHHRPGAIKQRTVAHAVLAQYRCASSDISTLSQRIARAVKASQAWQLLSLMTALTLT
jgi:hypothetical protein